MVTKMLDRISFLVGEALTGLRRNGYMTFSAITTVAISLYLLGGLGFAYLKASAYTKSIPSKFEIRVFFKDGTDLKSISECARQIRSMPGVAVVNLVPKAKAWAKYRSEHPDLTRGIDNPFPDALKVTLMDLSRGDELEQSIRSLTAVAPDGIQRLAAEQRLVEQLIKILGWLSSAGVLLLGIAGILIFNTIKMAILSRRIEIRIMQLVGASRFTMGFPFLLEGLFQGLIGGILAAGFVWATYGTIGYRLHQSLDVTWPRFPTGPVIVTLATSGGVFGAACSVLALRFRR